jgi:hypothetical protein
MKLPIRFSLLCMALAVALGRATAGDFERAGIFGSVKAFVAATQGFRPAESKSDLAELFATTERGQPEDPATGSRVVAATVDSCVVIWEGADQAMVFAKAAPKTEATKSMVGVLFLLSTTKGKWRISDVRKFEAAGKEAGVECELAAYAGTGYHLGGKDGEPVVVTVSEDQGGRGYSYLLHGSFVIEAGKIKPRGLE